MKRTKIKCPSTNVMIEDNMEGSKDQEEEDKDEVNAQEEGDVVKKRAQWRRSMRPRMKRPRPRKRRKLKWARLSILFHDIILIQLTSKRKLSAMPLWHCTGTLLFLYFCFAICLPPGFSSAVQSLFGLCSTDISVWLCSGLCWSTCSKWLVV